MSDALTEGRLLRVAFAGANASRAWARDAHLPAVCALPGFELVAVSARTQDLADAAATAFDAPKAYGDSLEMVRDPEIDVVAVTVKVPEHRAIVLAALEAGKHLYCEWPLGRDLTEAEEMAAAARATGVHVAVGLQGAHSQAVRHAAKLVHEGAIGRPLSLRVVSPTAGWGRETPVFHAYLQDRRNGATLSTIAGGHTLAAIEEIAGPFVDLSAINSILFDTVRVSGSHETVTRTSPDHVLMIGHHAGGCVSSLEVVGGEMRPAFLFEVLGENGTIRIEGGSTGGFQTGLLAMTSDLDLPSQPAPVVPDLEGAAVNVAELYAALERDIRTGDRTVPDFERAVRLTRLLDAVDLASDSGRRVALNS